MLITAILAAKQKEQQDAAAAQATQEQAAREQAWAEKEAAWNQELSASKSAMDQLVSDSNARVEAMRQAMEEADRLAKEEAEKQRLEEESAERVSTMKEAMAADSTATEEERLRVRKRRASLSGFTTLLTGGQGLTTSPTLGTKTLLGQ